MSTHSDVTLISDSDELPNSRGAKRALAQSHECHNAASKKSMSSSCDSDAQSDCDELPVPRSSAESGRSYATNGLPSEQLPSAVAYSGDHTDQPPFGAPAGVRGSSHKRAPTHDEGKDPSVNGSVLSPSYVSELRAAHLSVPRNSTRSSNEVTPQTGVTRVLNGTTVTVHFRNQPRVGRHSGDNDEPMTQSVDNEIVTADREDELQKGENDGRSGAPSRESTSNQEEDGSTVCDNNETMTESDNKYGVAEYVVGEVIIMHSSLSDDEHDERENKHQKDFDTLRGRSGAARKMTSSRESFPSRDDDLSLSNSDEPMSQSVNEGSDPKQSSPSRVAYDANGSALHNEVRKRRSGNGGTSGESTLGCADDDAALRSIDESLTTKDAKTGSSSLVSASRPFSHAYDQQRQSNRRQSSSADSNRAAVATATHTSARPKEGIEQRGSNTPMGPTHVKRGRSSSPDSSGGVADTRDRKPKPKRFKPRRADATDRDCAAAQVIAAHFLSHRGVGSDKPPMSQKGSKRGHSSSVGASSPVNAQRQQSAEPKRRQQSRALAELDSVTHTLVDHDMRLVGVGSDKAMAPTDAKRGRSSHVGASSPLSAQRQQPPEPKRRKKGGAGAGPDRALHTRGNRKVSLVS